MQLFHQTPRHPTAERALDESSAPTLKSPREETTMKNLFGLLALLVLLPVSAAAENAGWKASWEETLAAARQEGKVVVSGPPSAELRKALPAAFKARYGIN